MPEENSMLVILLGGGLGVLVLILLVLVVIARGLARMERRIGQTGAPQPAAVLSPATAGTPRRTEHNKEDFLEFLNEDPQRRTMPKREQFEVYRKWRKEKGLNWPRRGENSEAE